MFDVTGVGRSAAFVLQGSGCSIVYIRGRREIRGSTELDMMSGDDVVVVACTSTHRNNLLRGYRTVNHNIPRLLACDPPPPNTRNKKLKVKH